MRPDIHTLEPFDSDRALLGEDRINGERADRAQLALDGWLTGEGSDPESDIQDCISDLLHLAHSKGLDVHGLLSSAANRFVEETND